MFRTEAYTHVFFSLNSYSSIAYEHIDAEKRNSSLCKAFSDLFVPRIRNNRKRKQIRERQVHKYEKEKE